MSDRGGAPARLVPRVVIAGTASGSGKTTVASGLIGALRRRGVTVQGFKVGPDYIDPSYHALASGRPGRNLDAFLGGPELIAPLVRHGAAGADIAVIEGVMGMFDGASGRGELASTAHVAKLLEAPVLLVVDASAMARSAAAIVHGFVSFDPAVHVAGVIFNRVGSEGHAELLREAPEPLGVAVLGVLRRDERIAAPERHLGLIPVSERAPRAAEALDALAAAVEGSCELAAIESIARAAPGCPGVAWDPAPAAGPRTAGRIAIARGPAFSFHYEENLELLRAAGAELAPFDPTVDEHLPDGAGGLILAGGFPEVFGAELAANTSLRAEVRALAARGRPILAECGGLLYLLDALDDHPMCGVLPGRGEMAGRLTLGYREARVATATPWLGRGEAVRGHEFHYSAVESVAQVSPAWHLSARATTRDEGFVAGAVQASYLHVHWAAHPDIPARLIGGGRRVTGSTETLDGRARVAPGEKSLRHHGDRDVRPGDADHAVNVLAGGPPPWLRAALSTALAHAADRYPADAAARAATAARHGRDPDEIVVTNGAAEALWLIGPALRPRLAACVHPGFTEAEAALHAYGLPVVRVLRDPDRGFALDPDAVPETADLVVVGNPGWTLDRTAALLALRRPGRVVVVDEAFMEMVPGEPGSLAGEPLEDVIVIRSLTKLLSVPGLRVGYAIAPPQLAEALEAVRPPWSANALALATLTAAAAHRPQLAVLAERAAGERRDLEARLVAIDGIRVWPSPVNFCLIEVADGPGVVATLRARGMAVRPAGSFPGLGPGHIRVTARDPEANRRLANSLAEAVR